ncbi:DEKNAAC101297 [Brettanomyces naardenensis]|uniref:DEKNAAC101297 n=1 Tax=Brettanomyces naardenensis TaxID=13370 RepID=A0A448YI24_BRENA|nr:DEKNAAC101297 [Brettanomyces naardenensis]
MEVEAQTRKVQASKGSDSQPVLVDARAALAASMEVSSESTSASSSQSLSSQMTNRTTQTTVSAGSSQDQSHINGKVSAGLRTIEEHKNGVVMTVPLTGGNRIEEVDGDVSALLSELGELERKAKDNLKEINDIKLIELVRKVKQTLLRLNLSKNLLKYELKNGKEENQIERRMFLKSIANFERNLELMKNENQMITVKNLKLIRYCRQLKNEKLKKLKNENEELRRRLEDDQMGQFDELNENQDKKRGKKRRSDSSNDAVMASRQSSNVNMLDTLGRLASHVLQDEDFIKTTSDRAARPAQPAQPSKSHSFSGSG